MCDMQKMPTREDASCEEDSEMNFATFSAVGGGTHFVTAGGQIQKIQQNVPNNGGTLQQVVGMVGGVNMGDGVQYVRAIDGSGALQATPQLISVPIALPGAKPGDPQPTVQIQVLSPNMLQAQQQPKYQMQIPIQGLQGFQQGGAVLTLAYSPENNESGGIQLLGNTLPEGLQVLQMPQEMQLMPQEPKQEPQQQIQHQVFITPNQQIIINNMEDGKVINNNNTVSNNNNSDIDNIVIKEECDENMNDDVSINNVEDGKAINNNMVGNNNNSDIDNIVIKEECDENMNDDVSINNVEDGKAINNNMVSNNNNNVVIKEECDENVNDDVSINNVEDGKAINNNTVGNNSDIDNVVIKEECDENRNDDVSINNVEDGKAINNNTVGNNNNSDIDNVVIKEECDENMNDDESSQGTETSEGAAWQATSASQADLIKYLNTLQPQQAQALPVSLQQFLKLNPTDSKRVEHIEIEVSSLPAARPADKDDANDAVLSEDGTLRIQSKKKKKYKKKPPRPARPKPGQVTIATAADGSPIFCCPECQLAYPEKEQLEMHLIVHKIERRFICGICGAGLKRKEHLERHKLGHNPERPFVCGVCLKGFKRREHLNLHTVIHSGVKTELCGECGKGFYRKDHLRKHTRSHEHRRMRDEAAGDVKPVVPDQPDQPDTPDQPHMTILPEITIHVPTSANMNVPVQINIPQHVMSSLAAQAQSQAAGDAQLDALLARHS